MYTWIVFINRHSNATTYLYVYELFVFHIVGVCLGMQVAVIEFARNVLGWKGTYIHMGVYDFMSSYTCVSLDANSKEFDPSTSHPVVSTIP